VTTGSPDSSDEPRGEEALTDERGKPVPVESMYLEEVSPFRPILTGDIFRGVTVPGAEMDDEPTLAMVIGHPSGMRSGAMLNARIRTAPVVTDPRLSAKKAATHISDIFGLPRLSDFTHDECKVDSGPWGVRVDLSAPVLTELFTPEARCACLSPKGIALLVQCVVNSDTRVLVREDTISTKLAPKLLEIEWLENWNEDLVRPRVEAGGDLVTELLSAAIEFETVMEADRGGGQTLHRMIADVTSLPPVEAERIMATELRARRAALLEN
jgi:hypothetical protein